MDFRMNFWSGRSILTLGVLLIMHIDRLIVQLGRLRQKKHQSTDHTSPHAVDTPDGSDIKGGADILTRGTGWCRRGPGGS